MPDLDTNAARRSPTVFLSYASEDRQAARSIGAALPAYGLEVWYDESELGGGELWDQKIRKQIRECDYFMALVSAQTEARHEGYFRREWRLAVERTLDMADDHLFLLPIVIDHTDQARARVPEKFLSVQWLKVPKGEPTPALETLCRRIASGASAQAEPKRKASAPPVDSQSLGATPAYPDFPRQEPGQKISFWVHLFGWVFKSAWMAYKRLPRWLRAVAVVWLSIFLLSHGCTPRHQHDSSGISASTAAKLKAISDQYKGSTNAADITKLGEQIAREFEDADAEVSGHRPALLAVPFTAPAGDGAAEKLADSAFAMVYGRIALSHRGHLGLTDERLSACDLGPAVERGRAKHARYVLCGAIDAKANVPMLTIKIAATADNVILWTKSYPVANADSTKIATEVAANVPAVEDD